MDLRSNRIYSLLEQNKTVKGSFIFTAEPAYVEIMGYAGLDFVLLDMEHSPCTATEVVNLVRAAEVAGVEPVIRVSAK